MCTLILGFGVVEPRSVIVAANRDEDPARPTRAPHVLGEHPHLVGGLDERSGGTWLAVRDRHAMVALLNRRPRGTPAAAPRSRGLLTLDVAGVASTAGKDLAATAEARLRAEIAGHEFAPHSLLFASPDACWVAGHVPGEPLDVRRIEPGWHVVTHEPLDDPGEPRTRGLLADLAGWRPASLDQAIEGLEARLAIHAGERDGIPAVCIHEGRMPTVSSSLVWLAEGPARYFHAEGRPCVTPWNDFTALLEPKSETRNHES